MELEVSTRDRSTEVGEVNVSPAVSSYKTDNQQKDTEVAPHDKKWKLFEALVLASALLIIIGLFSIPTIVTLIPNKVTT